MLVSVQMQYILDHIALGHTVFTSASYIPLRWNGGNILESFLEIIDHNKITNHLIGVMDDETEDYLKV